MRNLYSKAIKTLALGSVLFMSSCLEDKGYLDIFNGENDTPVISFGQSDYNKVVKTVEVTDQPQTLGIVVNVARAKGPVTVTLEIDQAALDAYNAAELAKDEDYVPFELLPDSTYDVNQLTLTIPEGQLDTDFQFQVTSSKIDLTEKYMLPLVIKSVTEGYIIASNLNTALVAVVVKNKYDGQYTMMDKPAPNPFTSTMTDVINGALSIYKPWQADLVTNGADEVILQDREGYFGDPRIHIIKSGTSISGYGSFGVVFKFDVNTNKVIAVTNIFGQPAGNTRSAKLDPTGVNEWNPVTKELRVKYFMIQTNQASGTDPRVYFDEYYRYDGPRP